MGVTLRPHQQKALREMNFGKILAGGVGSGKTITAIAFYILRVLQGSVTGALKPKHKVDLYVITTAMKRDELDWDKELSLFGISKHTSLEDLGFSVTVDSWHNLHKYADVKDAFFIFDEQRLSGKGKWVRSFLKLAKHNCWILLSATPGDVWIDYIPVFVANGFYRNRTDFYNKHVEVSTYAGFPQIKKYHYTDILEDFRAKLIVEMPFERHTTRHKEYILAEYNKKDFETLHKKRWNIFENRPVENVSELYASLRKVTGSDPARLDVVKKIAEKHDRLIIFYNFNHELEQLRKLGELLDRPIAERNGHKHQSIPDTKKWVYLVQYASGHEAWNCVTTNAMIFYSLNYAYRVMEQAEGRIDRLDTKFKDLYYYYILTDTFLDRGILRALKRKRNFNEKAFSYRAAQREAKATKGN